MGKFPSKVLMGSPAASESTGAYDCLPESMFLELQQSKIEGRSEATHMEFVPAKL